MKILSALFLSAAIATAALATEKPDPKPQPALTQSQTAKGGTGIGIGKGGNAASKSASSSKSTSIGVNSNTNTAKGGSARQGQVQGQSSYQGQGQSMGGQANSQGVTVEGDDYDAAAYAPDAWGNNTAPCIKATGLSFGTVGATGGLSLPQESQNCWAERRADQMAAFAADAGYNGGTAGLVYLAGQDPAACAYAESKGLVACQPRGNALNQTMPSRITALPPERVCRWKGDGTRTVVTNMADKMACARSLPRP